MTQSDFEDLISEAKEPPPYMPARDWILIDLEETKYTGNLIIPETAKDAPVQGLVLAVGPGADAGSDYNYDDLGRPIPYPLITKVGDRILFSKYTGNEIEWNNHHLLFIKESEIIAYIKEPSNG